MGTIMGDWRELRSCAVVILLFAGVSATTVISCGGGGGGGSNGELCQQCGDSDGPCRDTFTVTDEELPSFCGGVTPCMARLRCIRKLDSAQRRCFPADPATNALDLQYRCDGARPEPDGAPTTTATPTPTFTPSATPTPTSTGPTATGLTVTPTGSTPTPAPTATPDEVDVSITIGDDDGAFTSSFTVTVTYPPSKGNFLQGTETDCDPDDGLTAKDEGNGMLTLEFLGNPEDAFPIGVTCIFHQNEGQMLVDSELIPSGPNGLIVEIESS